MRILGALYQEMGTDTNSFKNVFKTILSRNFHCFRASVSWGPNPAIFPMLIYAKKLNHSRRPEILWENFFLTVMAPSNEEENGSIKKKKRMKTKEKQKNK